MFELKRKINKTPETGKMFSGKNLGLEKKFCKNDYKKEFYQKCRIQSPNVKISLKKSFNLPEKNCDSP